ncbi:bifunctional 2-polyprenyl-6-hydroxyphenol methylase/3-demethylubiquinol 3-O-methyltransferase UbiG [Ferrimonas sediminicola]|uniref:Ubiquinone biosynthesis O-methyltransferase n=1 Tax=Ferrimonas sediminicola TaxID=2569538 RepID=A0A4U1BIG7_9GAMM|nr:bifunctional 2-polyprenyl-6-hydroxyphenol methylase/3-demethylubiquinol 3-O-methyltransferase UbiG [Ferrimonas sediminicola]TKB50349.1 bifunctional 2-polyprenyl-6-hydroxyphenol methylase/3-demethylubiquinol 3-O-methyltransferase UbiG [Ferrimonas sediminicola]
MLSKDNLTGDTDNLSPEEIRRFDALAEEWRKPDGAFKTVLAFNQVRLQHILAEIRRHFGRRSLSILDVGCGAGLLTEPLAGAGHQVLGIDASAVNIRVARKNGWELSANLSYRHCLTEVLCREQARFDLVLNTEVVEHVPNPVQLLQECAELVKPGGMMVVATLNRTWQSYLIGIIGAEYLLKALPKGTHSWRAFVTPAEIGAALAPLGFHCASPQGMAYNPLSGHWRLCRGSKVNYLVSAIKDDSSQSDA